MAKKDLIDFLYEKSEEVGYESIMYDLTTLVEETFNYILDPADESVGIPEGFIIFGYENYKKKEDEYFFSFLEELGISKSSIRKNKELLLFYKDDIMLDAPLSEAEYEEIAEEMARKREEEEAYD